MRDIPNWVIPVAVIGAGMIALRKLKDVGAGAQKVAQETGEKISASVFDFLNPSLRPENYNKPTVVNAQMVGGKYVCPKGYRYKLSAQGAHICLRED